MSEGIRLDRGRGPRPIEWIATGGTLLVLAGSLVFSVAAQRVFDVAKARAWTASGAPCPGLSRAAYLASGERIVHQIVYDDVRFGRGYGYVNCVEVLGGVPVCQFNSPTVLEVATRRGDFYFATQMNPATISVAGGVPRCVLKGSARGLAIGYGD